MSLLKGPDAPSFTDLSACVHCGMCLEVCPTYRELRTEMDSPRGRLYLIRGLIEDRIEPTDTVLQHLDRCLDCRACETACPSTVQYGQILEKTRTLLQPVRRLSALGRLLRWFALDVLLPSRRAQAVTFKLLWLLQRTRLDRVGRWRVWPRWMVDAAAQSPRVPFRSFRQRHANALCFPARGARRLRVALFTGCLADQLFADVNEAAVRVLVENGCDVEVLRDERCCGALHIHNGARDQAKPLAAENVRAFRAGDYDAIVSTAAGCSAELRHYGDLLGGDAAVQAFAGKVRDISELLCDLGLKPPSAAPTPAGRVAYDEPCHLLHAQKISDPPRQILRAIPGLTLVPLEEADACCGGAGIYWLQQPELSQKVSDRKIDAIRRSGAEIVATGNPGCLLQIRGAAKAAGLKIQVVHPIELLAAAYARSGESDPARTRNTRKPPANMNPASSRSPML